LIRQLALCRLPNDPLPRVRRWRARTWSKATGFSRFTRRRLSTTSSGNVCNPRRTAASKSPSQPEPLPRCGMIARLLGSRPNPPKCQPYSLTIKQYKRSGLEQTNSKRMEKMVLQVQDGIAASCSGAMVMPKSSTQDWSLSSQATTWPSASCSCTPAGMET